DDYGGHARRFAARDRRGHGRRAAAAARHRDRRGIALFADVDPLYDAGCLSLSRPAAAAVEGFPASTLPRARAGGSARMTSSSRQPGRATAAALAGIGLLAAGCAVGPRYQRPSAPLPAQAVAPPEGWKTARPQDDMLRGS